MFEKDFYSPALTGNRVSSEEVNQFFSKIHSAIRKPFPENSKRPPPFLLGFALMFLVPFISWNLAGYFGTTLEKSILFFFIGAQPFFLYTMWPPSVNKSRQQPLDILFERCQDIVDEQNEILRDRGLKWRLPAEFPYWIELTKDLKKQADEFQVNTEEKITFNLKRGRYSKDFYSPDMTDGKISHEEMHEFISRINDDLRRPPAGMNPGWFVFFLLFDAWVIALLKINDDFPYLLSSRMNYVIVIILLALSTTIATWVGSWDDRKFKGYFQGLISEFNEILRSRGLRWNLPSKFPDSIELYKDYQEDDSSATSSEDDGEATHQNENRRNRSDLSVPLLEDHD